MEACISGQLRGMPKGALSPGVEGGRGSRSNYPHDPAGSSLMVQLLAQKAGLDDKVKVFVLYVEPITDMIDRSLKADAH